MCKILIKRREEGGEREEERDVVRELLKENEAANRTKLWAHFLNMYIIVVF